jgi:lipoate-protein ligase B
MGKTNPTLLSVQSRWPYADGLAFMEAARIRVLQGGPFELAIGDHHAPVITLGRRAEKAQILTSPTLLEKLGVQTIRVDRGGGATCHGPGQIIVYPVFRLAALGLSVGDFTRQLAQCVIDVLADQGIEAAYDSCAPGVYVEGRKVASIGLHLSRGITTHGLAFNVKNDLSVFSHITPCGQPDQAMTSLAELSGGGDVDFLAIQRGMLSALERRLVLEWQSCDDQTHGRLFV